MFWGPFIETNNFAFEVKAIIGQKSTHLESRVAKIGLNGSMTNKTRVWKYFWGLVMATSNFAFEVNATLDLESTHLELRVAKIGLNGPHD